MLVALVAGSGAACRRSTSPEAATTTTLPVEPSAGPTDDPPPGELAAVEEPSPSAPPGGAVRVAVWAEPDPASATMIGATLRALVLPQLFVARSDGRWVSMLAEPGSDVTGSDGMSATIKLRARAAWSDGTAVTVEDLRRSADARFVAAIDGPAADGAITIRFTQRLPGWRRLWSGVDSVSAPRPGVWGGPYRLTDRQAGLHAVLAPNPGWRGPPAGPAEVRLLLVPDQVTARELLASGEIDVVAPLPDTRRTPRLRDIASVSVATSSHRGGRWTALLFDDDLPARQRQALATTIDRSRFVEVLLAGEATAMSGLGASSPAGWSSIGWRGDQSSVETLEALRDDTLDFVTASEEPLAHLVHRTMTKRARLVDGRLELRSAEIDRVNGWIDRGEYDVALSSRYDGPVTCWACGWGDVDAALATAADGGDRTAAAELEARAAAALTVVPLWREVAVVAWRNDRLRDIEANPYALGPGWDAWRWRVVSGGR